jgi:hypothetical protein
MTEDLKRLFAATPTVDHARLNAMESAVWSRVAEIRDRRITDQVRAATVAVAIMVGVANGGFLVMAQRPQPSEMRIFTTASDLSPLTGLDDLG